MKKGDLLDLQKGYDLFEYGDDYYLKLYESTISKKWIEDEFYKSNYVNSIYEKCIPAKEVIELEGRVGLLYPRVQGETFLHLFESNKMNIEIEIEKFAAIHADIHNIKCYELLDQVHYFKGQIKKCEHVTEEEKDLLMALLRELPEEDMLCHGNFHLNNVVLTGSGYKVLDLAHAYKGHPMSDVAKACIIMDVPRSLEGATTILHEELVKLKHRVLLLYIENYKKYGVYDEALCGQFYKLAALDRLNENHEHEREWLLHIIRD